MVAEAIILLRVNVLYYWPTGDVFKFVEIMGTTGVLICARLCI